MGDVVVNGGLSSTAIYTVAEDEAALSPLRSQGVHHRRSVLLGQSGRRVWFGWKALHRRGNTGANLIAVRGRTLVLW